MDAVLRGGTLRKKIFAILLAFLLAAVAPLEASATTVKMVYGTSNQAITITLTSLASAGTQGSAAIDNTTNLYLDALVFVKVKTNAAGTSATGYVSIYAYGTADGGTTYSDGVTGTDAAQTLTSPPNLRLVGVCNAVANATTYSCGPFAVSPAFSGILPDHWGIVVQNNTGAALDATVGSAWYQGAQAQVI